MINSFNGKYDFLSNFHYAPIKHDGIVYITNEHAFQAAKTLNFNERLNLASQNTPGQAKRHGRMLTLRSDWEDVKYSIMEEICAIKFLTHEDLRERLLDTRDMELIESNNWGDVVWGQVNGVGTNWLGKILMDLRSKLK